MKTWRDVDLWTGEEKPNAIDRHPELLHRTFPHPHLTTGEPVVLIVTGVDPLFPSDRVMVLAPDGKRWSVSARLARGEAEEGLHQDKDN